jgi:hypothetical protein
VPQNNNNWIKIFLKDYLILYENETLRATETTLQKVGEGKKGERWEAVNLTKIYYNHSCKCHANE